MVITLFNILAYLNFVWRSHQYAHLFTINFYLTGSIYIAQVQNDFTGCFGFWYCYLLSVIPVFFVLAASSVAIVVLASGFYSRQVKASSDSYSGRTALAYVTEKMHQNDENGAIADGTFDGENALVIRQRYDEKDYVTYLYAYDGYLRELFIRDGTEAKASDGRKILATKDFEAKETSDGIFHLYCENEDGKKIDTFVSVKSAAR